MTSGQPAVGSPPQLGSLQEFLGYQAAGLIRSFNGPDLARWTPHAVLAAGYGSFEDAEAQVAMRDREYGTTSVWTPLGRRRSTSVRVLVDGESDVRELWARATYGGHRSAFLEFLGLFGLRIALNEQFDVDHLFARSRLRSVRDGVVRLVLAESAVNRGWGSWLERLEVGWDSGKPRHAARAVQIAKALGVPPPSGPIAAVDLSSLHDQLLHRGLDLSMDELVGNFAMARRQDARAGRPRGAQR